MVKGIDVSDFQSVASFHTIQQAGFGFVVAKATQGTGNVQETFHDYASRARSIGLPFGAYHFLSWVSDPAAQAAHFLSVYRPQNGDLPPMLDCEACAVSPDAAVAQVAGFLRAVEPHLGGARMLLYMSYSFAGDHLKGGSAFSGHPLWVAAYEDTSKGIGDVTPTAWKGKSPGALFWQYSDDVPVPGIPGAVDGDLFVGDTNALNALRLKGL